ncbi:MAG: hypothetical protein D6797_07410 [Bdellovibrio sp.]|nr:MAG: hypothetical protein D6797_07410 [Bdellovibrio sp.]
MKLKYYIYIWLILTLFLGWEYYAIRSGSSLSVISLLHSKFHWKWKLTTEEGKFLSYSWGVIGLGLMVVMNVYSLRKRLLSMSKWGRIGSWLHFHIFCGLLGPTFIIFHSDFKVRGLVAISFWCMMISATSGIIGRYLYIQVLGKMQEHRKKTQAWERRILRCLKHFKVPIDEEEVDMMKSKAVQFVGIPRRFLEGKGAPLLLIFLKSIWGDFKHLFVEPSVPSYWPKESRYLLGRYGVEMKRQLLLGQFQRLLGYWHAFHFPFAIFMYITAVLHVLAVTLFQA